MILEEIQRAFYFREELPKKLLVSHEGYFKIMRDSRCIDASWRADLDGKLGATICGCPIQISQELSPDFLWVYEEEPRQVITILN